MSTKFEIMAESRDKQGTAHSRRYRHAGKIPGIIYGGGKTPESVLFDHNSIFHLMENEAFHTSILTIKSGDKSDQAILRDVQYHPHKQVIMHMDLQRISATEKIHMSIPLHITGEEMAPGVKQQAGIVSHLLTDVDVICLPSQLPEFLPIDISALNLGESLHLSDIKLPEGVALTTLSHGGQDLAVVAIVAPKVVVEETPEVAEEAEGEEAAEGEEQKTEDKDKDKEDS